MGTGGLGPPSEERGGLHSLALLTPSHTNLSPPPGQVGAYGLLLTAGWCPRAVHSTGGPFPIERRGGRRRGRRRAGGPPRSTSTGAIRCRASSREGCREGPVKTKNKQPTIQGDLPLLPPMACPGGGERVGVNPTKTAPCPTNTPSINNTHPQRNDAIAHPPGEIVT